VHDIRENRIKFGNYVFHESTLQVRVSFPVSIIFIWSQATGRKKQEKEEHLGRHLAVSSLLFRAKLALEPVLEQ